MDCLSALAVMSKTNLGIALTRRGGGGRGSHLHTYFGGSKTILDDM